MDRKEALNYTPLPPQGGGWVTTDTSAPLPGLENPLGLGGVHLEMVISAPPEEKQSLPLPELPPIDAILERIPETNPPPPAKEPDKKSLISLVGGLAGGGLALLGSFSNKDAPAETLLPLALAALLPDDTQTITIKAPNREADGVIFEAEPQHPPEDQSDLEAETGLPDQALIILKTENETAMQETIDQIEAEGGNIVHVFPPDILIGSLTSEQEKALLDQKNIKSIHRDQLDPSTVPEKAKMVVAVWNSVFVNPKPRPISAQEVGEPPKDDALIAPDLSEGKIKATEQNGKTPGYYQTSEVMIGTVAVGVILPESDGSKDPSTENWTLEEEQQVFNEIVAGLNWWILRAQESGANLRFIIPEMKILPTSYEPINRPHTDQGLWIGEAMGELGYDAASYFTQVRDYNNALREQYETDWAFPVFVIDSSNDPDNNFANEYFAYAYLGGPFSAMTNGCGFYGPDNMRAVFAHELAHLFRALDQYWAARQDCTYRSGYLWGENQNSEYNSKGGQCASNEDSLLRRIYAFWSNALDYYARVQVGWRDSDGDDILDPVDTTPEITLVPQAENPTLASIITYLGSVEDIPWPSPCSSPWRPDITINTITGVDYRLNNGEWQPAAPINGKFDSAEEPYTFTLNLLDPGIYVVDVQAINSVGNRQILPEGDFLAILDPEGRILDSWLRPSEPTTSTTPILTGWAAATPTVAGVECQVDNSPSQAATAKDGVFDGIIEPFTCQLPELPPGSHFVQAWAIDPEGNKEASPSTVELTIEGPPPREPNIIYIPMIFARYPTITTFLPIIIKNR